jgi:hypothetical protein
VTKDWFVDPKNKTQNLGLQLFSFEFYLLGIVRGHWESQDLTDFVEDVGAAERFNMGIAIATPIQECFSILNGEVLRTERRKVELASNKL